MHYLKTNLIKSILLSISFLFFCGSFAPNKNNNIFVLVLDAGHGGDDGGAKGYGGIREKDITLDVTLALGKLIEKTHKDVKVIYTRETDVFIPLQERARIANKNKASLFISIHCNATNNLSASGTETYVLGLHRNEENFEVSKRENSVIFLEDNYEEKYEGFDPRSPASVIGLTLLQNTHLDNSILFAKHVEDNFILSNRLSRGVKQAGFLVLRQTAMPSVLTEIGFITNSEEGLFLGSEEGKGKVVEDIYKSFKKYKDFIEDKSKGVSVNKIETPKVEEKPVKDKIFRVQFLTSKNQYKEDSPFLKGLYPIEIIKYNDTFRYYYGGTSYESEKNKQLKTVKSAGFSDAFISEFDKINTKEVYSVQLIANYKKLSDNYFTKKGLKEVKRVKEDGMYKYFYKKSVNYEEIKKNLSEIKTKGFKDAFIIFI